MTDPSPSLCYICRLVRPIVHRDEDTGLGCCEDCIPLARLQVQDLLDLAFLSETIPFLPGDRVECRTAGIWLDGRGSVTAIDQQLEHGGTPVYPTFHVVIDEPVNDNSPTEAWYTEVCLTKVV